MPEKQPTEPAGLPSDRPRPDPLAVAPRPALDDLAAADLAQDLFGVSGEIHELGSHQDRNFRIDTGAGRVVLKVANRAWGRAALEAQNAALQAVVDAGFAAPQPIPALDGSLVVVADVAGEALPVRLLGYVEGTPLSGAGYLAPGVVADLGRLAGRTAAALAGFDHPGLDRVVQWDLRQAGAVVEALLGAVRDPQRRDRVAAVTAAALARLDPIAGSLRVQAIHGDVTDDNVVGDADAAGRVRPAGVIDFGDLMRSWLVAELAVTCSSVLRHRPDAPLAVLEAVRAFDAVVPLDDADLAALWPLVVLRGAALVVSGEHQAALDPDNPSATGPLESEWTIFRVAADLPFAVAEEAARAALGRPATAAHAAARAAVTAAAPLLPMLGRAAVLPLSVRAEDLHSGRFLEPEIEHRIAQAADASCTRWAQARLTRTVPLLAEEPATVALGVEIRCAADAPVHAPWAGTLTRAGHAGVVLAGEPGRLELKGVRALLASGTTVARSEPIAVTGAAPVWVQLCVEPDLPAPRFATATTRAAWTRLCPDPSPLLGLDVAGFDEPDDDPAALLARRKAAFAGVQEHYYDNPMQIERGWRHLLFDTDGRCYVDLVNNVAAIGHAHPRLTTAVHRQLDLLNTNSRFHYAAVAELSERLAALAPNGLDTVFLVNSGSEAVDLALRMTQVVTGRLDLVAVREAYHGWTMLPDAVTTSLYDNPRALESRPDWVHLASAPNAFRGRFRGEQAGVGYAQEVRDLVADLVAAGRPPAAYICEPLLGNAGGVVLPPGYLAAAYDAVRAAGGLAIADEVQVGYGRTGHHWWAYEAHGVTPDVITVAKAMGNGHPLGAVITRREVADAFAAQGSFFSSAGGSPVSCVVGLTVLDVIEQESLQENAARVGDHLLARFAELAGRHPLIGAVHGAGLYLGVELVLDRTTLEPATAQCAAICDRLRELGVVVQPTGERANVLKVKPPMCLTVEAADFCVDQLERVLTEGW